MTPGVSVVPPVKSCAIIFTGLIIIFFNFAGKMIYSQCFLEHTWRRLQASPCCDWNCIMLLEGRTTRALSAGGGGGRGRGSSGTNGKG